MRRFNAVDRIPTSNPPLGNPRPTTPPIDMARHVEFLRERRPLLAELGNARPDRPTNLRETLAIKHHGNRPNHTQFNRAQSKHRVHPDELIRGEVIAGVPSPPFV